MEVRNIHTEAKWYASYEDSDQGKALIECQSKKIDQLTNLLDNIKGEIELTEEPKVHDEKPVLQSIKALIEQCGDVEHVEGIFKWIG